jgi:hypothetical protein
MISRMVAGYRKLNKQQRIILFVCVGIIFLTVVRIGVWKASKNPRISPRGYVRNLRSPESKTRLEAIQMVGTMRIVSAIPKLEALILSDPDESVRLAAAWNLGILDKPKLLALLKTGDTKTRLLVMETLVKFGKENLSHIEDLMDDSHNEIRLAALSALANAGSQYGEKILQYAEDTEQESSFRVACLLALQRAGGPEMVTRLFTIYYNDPDPEIKKIAQETMVLLQKKSSGHTTNVQ